MKHKVRKSVVRCWQSSAFRPGVFLFPRRETAARNSPIADRLIRVIFAYRAAHGTGASGKSRFRQGTDPCWEA